jgi:hypothetical protein
MTSVYLATLEVVNAKCTAIFRQTEYTKYTRYTNYTR